MFSGPTVGAPVKGGGSAGPAATGGLIGAHPMTTAAISATEIAVMLQALALIERSSTPWPLVSAG